MEELDIFDESFTPLPPFKASIDTVHKNGLWHQTVTCWLINPQSKLIFLQLRGPKNRVGPNTFDASGSGHLSSGETPDKGFREVDEELGSNLNLYDKTYLGFYRNIIMLPNYTNREFCHVYLAKTNADLATFELQQGEVSGIFSMDIFQGIQLFQGRRKTLGITGKIFNGHTYISQTRQISTADFCAFQERTSLCNYYLKVFLAAADFLKQPALKTF